MRRVARLLVMLVALPLCAAFLAPRAAHADGPTAMNVTGPGLDDAIAIRQTSHPDQFADLLAEVSWLAGRPGNAPSPDVARLGPKYVLVVFVNGTPQQTYDLYPMATGGPRVFRPAEQPNKVTVAAAWFYGRVSMPETLYAIGVPLNLPGGAGAAIGGAGGAGTGPGGVGGGEPVEVRNPSTTRPSASVGELLGQWQRQMLLVFGGAIALLVLIGGMARLVRRKV